MRKALLLTLLLALTTPAQAARVKFEREIQTIPPLFAAVDESGRVYLTLKNLTVGVMTPDGKSLLSLGGEDSPEGPVLKNPAGIAVYGDSIYVTDNLLSKVIVYSRDGEYLDSFGGFGSDPKEFMNPRGIFVREGVVYVADMGNNRVQVFGPNGVYMSSIGGEKGEAFLGGPTDVAADERGYVYAVDGEDRRVKVYDATGRYDGKLSGVRGPFSIAMDVDGFYISDTATASIKKYGFDREGILEFDSGGKLSFLSIGGIAADGKGSLYVPDTLSGVLQVYQVPMGAAPGVHEKSPPPTTPRWVRDIEIRVSKLLWDDERGILYAVSEETASILVFKDGQVIRTISMPGWSPVSIAQDPQGLLWVLDTAGNRLMKLDSDGRVVHSVGSTGSAGGQFLEPTDVVISKEGYIYVADRGNRRVQHLSPEGLFLDIVGKGGTSALMEAPSALAIDDYGILYVLDDGRRLVTNYSPSGLPLHEFGGEGSEGGTLVRPVDIALTESEVFILDAGKNTVQAFSPGGIFRWEFGTGGSGKGDFRDPASIVSVDDISLMVSDTGNGRIQELAMIYSPLPPRGLFAAKERKAVTLTWEERPEVFVDTYRLYRSEEEKAGFRKVAEVRKNVYIDEDVMPGVSYYYRVSSVAREGRESRLSGAVRSEP